ncbi:hypothetical protein BDK51DRAFT_46680, partial [Blyttiomyces helicus]
MKSAAGAATAVALKSLVAKIKQVWLENTPSLARLAEKEKQACANVVGREIERGLTSIVDHGVGLTQALDVLANVAGSVPPGSELYGFVQAFHNHQNAQLLRTLLRSLVMIPADTVYDTALAWYHFRIVMACAKDLKNFIITEWQPHLPRFNHPNLHHVAAEFKRIVTKFEADHPATDFTYPTTGPSYQRRFFEDSRGVFMYNDFFGEHQAIEYRDGDFPLMWLKQEGVQFSLQTSLYEVVDGPELRRRYLACIKGPKMTVGRVEGAFTGGHASLFTCREQTFTRVSLTSPGPQPSSIARTLWCTGTDRDKKLKKLGPFAMVVPDPDPNSTKTPGLLAIEHHGPLLALRFDPESDPTYLSIAPKGLLEPLGHLSPSCLLLPQLGCPPAPPTCPPEHDNQILHSMMQDGASLGGDGFAHAAGGLYPAADFGTGRAAPGA